MFYFVFSDGMYSDYRVNFICSCDHEVSEQEWEEHYLKYQEELKEKRAKNECNDEWRAKNIPEETFQKLHGMERLDIKEFWRDTFGENK